MAADPLTFRIPITVPRLLLPNNVTNTRSQKRRQRQFRLDVARLLRSEMVGRDMTFAPPYFTGNRVHCMVAVRWEKTLGATGKRSYRKPADPDNLIAAMKGLYDALQDVELIANDRVLIHHPPTQEHDPDERGYTLITIWEE